MTDHPNLERARAGYEAFAQGDMTTLNDLLSDDIVWHAAGNNTISGDYVGKEAVFGLLARIGQETGGSFKNEIHDLLANDKHGVALVNISAARGDKTIEGRSIHVFHMTDGKMTEFWVYPEDRAAMDAFWS